MFEVHYSSPKNKSFRQCPFEFCQARFTLLKDLKVSLLLVNYGHDFKIIRIFSYSRITHSTVAGI